MKNPISSLTMENHDPNGQTHSDRNPEDEEHDLLASDNEEGDLPNRPLHTEQTPAIQQQDHPGDPTIERRKQAGEKNNGIPAERSALTRFTQAVDNVWKGRQPNATLTPNLLLNRIPKRRENSPLR